MAQSVQDELITLVSAINPDYSTTLSKREAIISSYLASSLQNSPESIVFILHSPPATIEAACRYMQYCQGVEQRIIEPPLRSRRLPEIPGVDAWAAEFIDSLVSHQPYNPNQPTLQPLFDLAILALSLQIQSLVHLVCAKLATTIKSHPLDRVKSILLGTNQQAPIPSSNQQQDQGQAPQGREKSGQ